MQTEIRHHRMHSPWIRWCQSLPPSNSFIFQISFLAGQENLDGGSWIVWVTPCEAWVGNTARASLAASSEAWEVNNLQSDCCDLYRTAVGGMGGWIIAQVAVSDFQQTDEDLFIYLFIFFLFFFFDWRWMCFLISPKYCSPSLRRERIKEEVGKRLQRGRKERERARARRGIPGRHQPLLVVSQ